MQRQLIQVVDRRDGKRVAIEISDRLATENDLAQVLGAKRAVRRRFLPARS
jgi:hypothetical protein